MRVSEVKDRIQFCPTERQKADVLTKSGVTREIRDHVFHHNPQMRRKKQTKAAEETETEVMFTPSGAVCSFLSVTEYLEREWIPKIQKPKIKKRNSK